MNTTGSPPSSTPPGPAAGTPLPPPLPPRAEWRLVRAQRKLVAGVCSGLAVATGVDVTLVRIAFVVAGLSGVGIVAYLVLALVLPREDTVAGVRVGPAPPETARWIRIALLVVPILGLTGLLGRSWNGPLFFGWVGGGGGFGLLLVAVGLFVIWVRRRDEDRPAVVAPAPNASAEPVTRWASPSPS